MTGILLMFVSALAAALLATPLARAISRRLNFVDQPSARKIHAAPMPMLGGAAIYLAVLATIAFLGRRFMRELAGFLGGASLMFLLGLADDKVRLRAGMKFAGQAAIALTLYAVGIRVKLGWLPEWLNFAISMAWHLGITNAVNFLDNMDGLCAGVSAVAASFFMILAAIHGQFLVAALAAAVFGSCLGFLAYNRKPATIFMGDAGSLFLGITLAVIGVKLKFPERSNFVTWMVPLLVLGLPIFDTTLVVISRCRRGVNPFTTAGKDHLSHRLVQMGFSQLEAVLLLCLAGGFLGLMSLLVANVSVAEGIAIGLVVCAGSLLMLWKLEWDKAEDRRNRAI